ncbi:MAG: cold shock and DUF1294 domain-containing protein [Candidatus Thiodiazotropha sp.]
MKASSKHGPAAGSTRQKGKLTRWHDDRGYGFITPFSGGKRVFLHISAFEYRHRRPLTGDVLTYTRVTDTRGRLTARAVSIAGMRKQGQTRSRGPVSAYAVTALVLMLLILGVFSGHLPAPVLFYYLLVGAVTYLAYYFDKSAARAGHWRTRESTLHLLSLAGGWPGALLAQVRFRHKTRKQPFRALFLTTVVLNGALLGWLFSAPGKPLLQAILPE